MASGRIYGSVTSNKEKFNFFLDWSSEINVEGNYSTVSVKTYWSPKSGYSYWDFDTSGTRNASITINGNTYSIPPKRFYTGNDWSNGNPYLIMTHAVKVYHNDDGTKSISISARANGRAADSTTSYGPSSSTASSGDCVVPATTIVLDTIPRKSAVSCSTANIGANPTITITRAADTFTHTLRYEYGSFSDTIVEKTTSTSYTSWTIPTSFYNETPNAYGIGVMFCDTYNGDTLIGTTTTEFRVNVANSNPILNPTAKDNNSKTLALTGDENKFIKYYSGVAATVGATAQNAATIKSQSITINGVVKNGAVVGLTTGVESAKFVFSATDSRGFTTTKTLNKTLVPYIKLTCDVKLGSVNADGEATVIISGNFFSQSFGAVTNTLNIAYQIIEDGGSYSPQWTNSAQYNATNNTYEINIDLTGLDYKKTYKFKARAVDKLATVYSKELTIVCEPVFDWGKDSFRFNVPIYVGDDPINDYVIETGTEAMGSNGTWYWAKWKSGKAECYGCRNYGNMGVSNTWGVLFRSEVFTQSLPTGLFNSTPEVIDIVFRQSNFGAWIAKHEQSAPSAYSSGSFIVVRPASATLSAANISFNVVGRWK